MMSITSAGSERERERAGSVGGFSRALVCIELDVSSGCLVW